MEKLMKNWAEIAEPKTSTYQTKNAMEIHKATTSLSLRNQLKSMPEERTVFSTHGIEKMSSFHAKIGKKVPLLTPYAKMNS